MIWAEKSDGFVVTFEPLRSMISEDVIEAPADEKTEIIDGKKTVT